MSKIVNTIQRVLTLKMFLRLKMRPMEILLRTTLKALMKLMKKLGKIKLRASLQNARLSLKIHKFRMKTLHL